MMGTGRALTGVGLAAVVAAIVVALLANTSNPPSGQGAAPGLHVPAALAGTPLRAVMRGPQALEEVSRLHGRRIDGSDAVVARYGAVTLWISQSVSPLLASAQLWQMNRRMAGGTRVFRGPRLQEVRGRTVFETEGMGLVHFYYQSGARVLWVSVPREAAAIVLDELLSVFP